MPDTFFSNIDPLSSIRALKDNKMADTFYNRLRHHLEETEKQLKEDEQLCLHYYVRSGECISVSDIGYHNPNLIILYGRDSQGNECNILAHMESVELILRVVKVEKKAERRRIGFLNE